MDARLPLVEIIVESWRFALRGFVPSLPWLAGLMVSAGFYRLALSSAAGGNLPVAFILLAAVFVAGVAYSLRVYQAMLGRPAGKFLQLAHANLAAYMAFVFVGVFISFFLAILPGILLEASGRSDLGADTSPAVLQAAFMDMLPTAYGVVYLAVCAAGLWALCFLALRLLAIGAATVSQGETMVFRTWPWTRGHGMRLGLAAMGTHVAPFAIAVAANAALDPVLGAGPAGRFASGVLGVFLLAPFILAGHGLAVTVLRRLMPDANDGPAIAPAT